MEKKKRKQSPRLVNVGGPVVAVVVVASGKARCACAKIPIGKFPAAKATFKEH